MVTPSLIGDTQSSDNLNVDDATSWKWKAEFK